MLNLNYYNLLNCIISQTIKIFIFRKINFITICKYNKMESEMPLYKSQYIAKLR